MYEVKNLTKSPFDLQSINGPLRLDANGVVTGDFDSHYLAALKCSSAVEVNEVIDDLPAKYESLTGKKPDGRWSRERIAQEIEKLEP